MKDVFISYAHEDRDTARELAGLLEASGLSVWWDPQLRAGEDFAKIIEQTLQQVRCVIVLWSRHSVDSRWVRAEANEGLRLEKLVPVLLDESTPPLIFRALHTVRLEASDLRPASPGVQKLTADIRARMGSPDVSRPPQPPDATPLPAYRSLLAGTLVTLAGVLLTGWAGLSAHAVDLLTGLVAGPGSGLSPLAVEIALALIAAGALVGVFFRRPGNRPPYSVYVFAFVCGIVGYAWVERWLEPPADHLFGRVNAQNLVDLSVSAVDVGGRPVALRPVPVSTVDGTFGMRLQPVFANRPRFVVVRRPACPEVHEEIAWETWRERRDVVIEFNCN